MKTRFISVGLSRLSVIALAVGFCLCRIFAQSLEPWHDWERNPLTIPVKVAVTGISAEENTSVTVALNDGSVTQVGAGFGQVVNAPSFTSNLRVRQEYKLIVSGADLSSLNIEITPQGNWTPLSTAGRGAQLKQYFVLVDREFKDVEAVNPEGDGPYNDTWTIEIVERLPSQWKAEDRSDDPDTVAGTATWAQLGPGSGLDKSKAGISWSVSLGRLMDGMAVGRLSIRESGLSSTVYTPLGITFTAASSVARDEVDLINTAPQSGILRQVKAYQTFVDIIASANSTELRFYFPGQVGTSQDINGIYTSITGNPYVVWEIKNPQPGTTTKLQIIEHRNSVDSVTEYTYAPTSPTATWTLAYGSSPTKRIETRLVEIDSVNSKRIETVDIRYEGAATPAYRSKETYQLKAWGKTELVETRVVDPDQNPNTADDLITSMTFYEDSNDPATYKQLKSIQYPDGFWEQRRFDISGYPLVVLHPFENLTEAWANTDTSVITKYLPQPDYLASGGAVVSSFPSGTYDNDYRWEIGSRQLVTIQQELGALQLDVNRTALKVPFPSGAAGDPDKTYLEDVRVTPSEVYGLGVYGHPLTVTGSSGPAQVRYYNSVTYNPSTTSYTVHPSNGPGDGPDWRECILFTAKSQQWLYADGVQDYVEVVQNIDGQPVYDPVGVANLYPQLIKNKTWRESSVYQNGYLVLKEKHVFTGVDQNGAAQFELISKWKYQNDSLGHPINVTWMDGNSGASRTIYKADYKGTSAFDGELKKWEENEQWIRTEFQYDSLKRLEKAIKKVPGGADVTTTFAYDAYGRVLGRTTTAGGLSAGISSVFDRAGRITSQTDSNGLTTTFSYELGGRKVTKTLPSSKTEVRENYADRRLYSVTGNGVINEFHKWEYDDSADYLGTLHTIHLDSLTSSRIIKERFDWADRLMNVERPDWVSGQTISEHRVWNEHRPGLLAAVYRTTLPDRRVAQIYGYDLDGEQNASVVQGQVSGVYTDLNSSGIDVSLASDRRVTRQLRKLEKVSGNWFETTTTQNFRADNSATPTTISVRKERLNGFANGNILSEVQEWDADNSLTTTTTTVDQAARKVTEVTDVPDSTLNATRIIIDGLLRSETTPSVAQTTQFGYDALERQTSIVNSLNATSSVTFNANNQIFTTTDFAGITTSYTYWPQGQAGAGLVKSETVGGKTTYRSYTDRGELYRVWGDVPYPEERVYSEYGELKELRTFQGGTGWNGASWPAGPGTPNKTIWTYDPASGLLASKKDNLNREVLFTYDFGLLKTRKWARNITATYSYNDFAEVTGITYSDGTPSVAYVNGTYSQFDRRGLPRVAISASGVWTLAYDHSDRLTTATCASGLFNGITLVNHFNALQQRDWLKLQFGAPAQDLLQQNYGYDPGSGRLQTVSQGGLSATYAYWPNSDLVQTVTGKNGAQTKSVNSYEWEFGTRIKTVQNSADSLLTSHNYSYDSLGRRWRVTREDNSRWDYGYNDRNEVTSGKHYWSDSTLVAGQQYEYGYDSIGNRDYTRAGGDGAGNNLRYADYTPNDLNQYGSRGVPGIVDVVGLATAGQTVKVNGQTAGRHDDYYAGTATVNTGASSTSQTVTVELQGAGGTTSTGRVTLAGSTESFVHDLDGNLTDDALWTYGWDGEDRLIRATRKAITGLPNSERKELTFTYDDQGRRISKTVKVWNGSAFASPVTTRFIYDGWNLIAELADNNQLQRSYLWGTDLSGTMDGAGGVGGLLILTDHGTSTSHFSGFDGNGNVVTFVNATSGKASARYEYEPFGELIRATGPMAKVNPFRWGTKYWDEETDLIYYGYRYYSPSLGRWFNRDPLEEADAINLYAFVQNCSVNNFDPLGKFTFVDILVDVAGEYGEKSADAARGLSITSRVREVVDTLNAIESFKDGVIAASDALGTDGIDMLLRLQELRAEQAAGLRGKRSLAFSEKHGHHMFPQAIFKNFKKGKFDIHAFSMQISRALHLKGLHGGGYNKLFQNFLTDKDARIKNDPMYLIGFAFGVMKELGFGNYGVVPY